MNSKTISFAISAHHDTNHQYDGKPYSVHLAMVAYFAQKYVHYIPKNLQELVISACWLHDTIEDCRLTYNDILKVSGSGVVADIVYAVSNEKGKNRKQRANDKYYEGIRRTPFATFVKLCDRLANVTYSLDTNSKMFSVYQQEHDDFIKQLLVTTEDYQTYKDLIGEINYLLRTN